MTFVYTARRFADGCESWLAHQLRLTPDREDRRELRRWERVTVMAARAAQKPSRLEYQNNRGALETQHEVKRLTL